MMFNLLIKKRGLLLAGVFLLCSSQEVNWVYGQSNSAYTEVGWREPKIEILDRNFEFGIGAKFLVNIEPISDAKDIQLRIFRGDREELSGRKPLPNEDCVTFSSVVLNIKNINGHIEWGRVRPIWLAFRRDGGTEELSEQKFFVRFEFKNNIPQGYLNLHKETIDQYFGEKDAGFTITVVPRWENKMPSDREKKEWLDKLREWSKKSKKSFGEKTPSDCIQFVKSQNEESFKVAKAFKCHKLKT